MTCPAGPRPCPSAGQAKEWTMITANVGGQLGLDAYLCECIASDVLLAQKTRIPASSVEPTEARLRQIGWSASLTAALPALGNPTGGLITATPKRIGL
eukprot:447354-Pyramimonas_sp.AAC.1